MTLVAHPTGRPLRPDKLVSASTRNARRRRAEHRCARCGSAWNGPTWNCDRCRALSAAYASERRRNMTQEQRAGARGSDRVRWKRTAARKAERGQCPRGAHPSDRGPGRLCSRCLVRYRARQAARRAGATVEQRKKDSAYHAERWTWARQRGLCGECGRRPAVPERARCLVCGAAARRRAQARKVGIPEPARQAVGA